jgi:DNA-binding transcriptional ArsR family regulator
MLARLASGPASVSELAQPLKMSLPAVMQHLKALEESGLIRSEKKGRVRTCRLQRGCLPRPSNGSWTAAPNGRNATTVSKNM